MDARNIILDDFIRGRKQFVVPLFQRHYCWENNQWADIWTDIEALCTNKERPRTHFIGSVVTIQREVQANQIPKYDLIDGQQRLTTIFILLALLRDRSRQKGIDNARLADEIQTELLINSYAKADNDVYKLMPTYVDRDAYKTIIEGEPTNSDSRLHKAYKYFDGKLKTSQIEYEKIKDVVTQNFTIVTILLGKEDNPYVVFECLNFKGQDLTQADLVRNYFFMQIDQENLQKSAYDKYWLPMEETLGKEKNDDLTKYLRHFLMRNSDTINQNEVYREWRQRIGSDKPPLKYLEELKQCSKYYLCIIKPDEEKDLDLRKHFIRLNKINVTTAYPLMLNFYNDYQEDNLSKDDFLGILGIIENFLIRRFVCNIPTNTLNTIFASVCLAMAKHPDGQVEAIKMLLQGKKYPKDDEFFNWFQQKEFGQTVMTKLILETLEENLDSKQLSKEIDQKVNFASLQIEHIMPKNPTKWKDYLGDNWEQTHKTYLNAIGNLTLTGYNQEMGNLEFEKKKKIYVSEKDVGLNLNKYIVSFHSWGEDSIKKRAKRLAEQALEIWPYFGQDNSSSHDLNNVTGATPTHLSILDQDFEVKTWKEILEKTLNIISDYSPDDFKDIATLYPNSLGIEKGKFRNPLQLENGYFVEANLSAKNIVTFCYQVIQQVGLSSEDWNFTTTAVTS